MNKNTKTRSWNWTSPDLCNIFFDASEEDRIQADLENITRRQYIFNHWLTTIDSTENGFRKKKKKVKLSRWKCWLWTFLPNWACGGYDSIVFRNWSIGHCLNCDADPYDGTVEAWSYDNSFYRGALIRCNKCGQLRWQVGDIGTDY